MKIILPRFPSSHLDHDPCLVPLSAVPTCRGFLFLSSLVMIMRSVSITTPETSTSKWEFLFRVLTSVKMCSKSFNKPSLEVKKRNPRLQWDSLVLQTWIPPSLCTWGCWVSVPSSLCCGLELPPNPLPFGALWRELKFLPVPCVQREEAGCVPGVSSRVASTIFVSSTGPPRAVSYGTFTSRGYPVF